MKSVLITGVSSGIGLAAARMLTNRGYRVFGSVRKPADGEAVRSELGQRYVPLLFDVTDHGAVQRAVSLVRVTLKGESLAALINNAGISLFGPLMHVPIEEFRRQLDVNVVGLLDVTQEFLPRRLPARIFDRLVARRLGFV